MIWLLPRWTLAVRGKQGLLQNIVQLLNSFITPKQE
jgi:hypothetical protein